MTLYSKAFQNYLNGSFASNVKHSANLECFYFTLLHERGLYMATSIFVYNLTPSTSKLAADIYKTLSNIPDDGPNYFNLQLLNENELSGEYVIVQTVE